MHYHILFGNLSSKATQNVAESFLYQLCVLFFCTDFNTAIRRPSCGVSQSYNFDGVSSIFCSCHAYFIGASRSLGGVYMVGVGVWVGYYVQLQSECRKVRRKSKHTCEWFSEVVNQHHFPCDRHGDWYFDASFCNHLFSVFNRPVTLHILLVCIFIKMWCVWVFCQCTRHVTYTYIHIWFTSSQMSSSFALDLDSNRAEISKCTFRSDYTWEIGTGKRGIHFCCRPQFIR